MTEISDPTPSETKLNVIDLSPSRVLEALANKVIPEGKKIDVWKAMELLSESDDYVIKSVEGYALGIRFGPIIDVTSYDEIHGKGTAKEAIEELENRIWGSLS